MTTVRQFFLLVFLICSGTVQAQQRFDFNRLLDAGKDIATLAKGISEEQEIEIGRGLAGRMLGQVELVNDPAVQNYVNRVGRWVASQSERPDLPWRFGVANAANVNALAMPGGVILITRGLYDMLDNEAQLAGVLGHEIAHVVKRHHVNVMRQQAGVSAVANLAAARSGDNALRQVVLDLFKKIFISGLDKNSEFEADAAGVILAARAGYNPFGLAEVLHKLSARGADPALAALFGSHPPPSERIVKLGELLTPRLEQLAEGLEPPLGPIAARAAPPRSGATPNVLGAKALVNERPGTKPPPASITRQKPGPAPVIAPPVPDDYQSAGTVPAEVAPDAAAAQKPASGGVIQGIRNLFGGSSGSASDSAPAEAQAEGEPAQKPASGGMIQGIRNFFGGGSTAKPAPEAPAENTEVEAAEGAAEDPAQKPASKPSGGLMDGIRGIFGR